MRILAPYVNGVCYISTVAVISFLPMLMPFCCGAKEYQIYFAAFMVLCSILLLYVVNRNANKKLHVSEQLFRIVITDLFFAIYLAAGLLNMAFTAKSSPEPLWFCKWGTVIVAYLSGRVVLNKNRNLLYLFISISGAIQSFIAILQYTGVLGISLNGYFPHSGSFQTPGALGVFVSFAIICNIYLLYYSVKAKRAYTMLMLAGSLIISVAGLIVSDSRTAIIALMASSLLYLWRRTKNVKAGFRYLFYFITTLSLLGATLVIYGKRPNSVGTRMLLWKVSLTMNKENPVIGNGVSSFSRDYMPCQEIYFRLHPSSEYAILSNNHYQSYNAFLQIYVEQGLLGIMVTVTLLTLVLIKSRKDAPPIYLLVCWFTASSFLYISDIPVFMILMAVFMGITESKDTVQFSTEFKLQHARRMVVASTLLVGLLAGCIVFGITYRGRYNYALKNIDNSVQNSLYDKNIFFALLSAKSVFRSQGIDIEDKIAIMEMRMKRFSTSEMLIDLGDLYTLAGRFDKAEECYLRAFYMVPCRIIPLYKLFILYDSGGNESMARDTAMKIVAVNTSVVNSLTIKIKSMAAKYLLPDKERSVN